MALDKEMARRLGLMAVNMLVLGSMVPDKVRETTLILAAMSTKVPGRTTTCTVVARCK